MAKLNEFAAIALVTAFGCTAVTFSANASLVEAGTITLSAQGFGNAPRLITLQSAGNNTTETGATSFAGGAASKSGDIPPPPGNPGLKWNVPTIGSLNWNSADDVQLLFNPTEPGGSKSNITINTLAVC